jgi:hypothetical protein
MKHPFCTHRFRKNLLLISPVLLLLICMGAGAALAAVTGSVTFQSNLGGSARYALQSGTYLYSVIGTRLYIADISDIQNPVEIASLPIPGIGRRLEKKGTVLYIACTEGGLATVDVSDPVKPALLGTLLFDTTAKAGEVFDVTLNGDIAYVADYRTGLYIVDIKDPSSMVIKGSFTNFENQDGALPYDVYINGTNLYVCCEHDGLYIFDITSPLQLSLQSHFSGPAGVGNQFYQSFRDGNYLYIAGGIAGLVIADVSDIKTPLFVTNFENNYQGVLAFVKSGNFVYLCTEFTDFYKIDVTDVMNPKQVESFPVDGNHSLGISREGNYVFLANSNFGIRIFDISGQSISQRGYFASLGRVIDCHGLGKYAYVAAGKNGMQIFDVIDSQHPVLVSKTVLAGYANGLCVQNGKVYVAELLAEGQSSGGFLEIVDAANPAAPAVLGKVDLDGEPFDVLVSANIAYVASQTKGVSLVDVSNASAPVLLSAFDTAGVCYQVALWGNYLTAADGTQALSLLDVENSVFPQKVSGGYDIGTIQDICLWDTTVYLAAGTGGVFISDISLPYAPTTPANVIIPETNRGENGAIKVVTSFDSYLLAPDSTGGLRLFDIADPAQPVELDHESYLRGDPIKVTYDAQSGLAYVSSQIAGLYIYTVETTAGPGIDLDGLWSGSIVSAGSTIGVTAEFDQTHASVSGTVSFFASAPVTGQFSGTVTSDTTLSGTITSAGKNASFSLTYDNQTNELTGETTGEPAGTVRLKYVSKRGYLDSKKVITSLQDSVTARAADARGLEKMGLGLANNVLDTALGTDLLSARLASLGSAELLLSIFTRDNAIAAENALSYSSAKWETLTWQAIATTEATDICTDNQQKLTSALSSGDFFLQQGLSRGDRGNYSRAISLFSQAVKSYESVSALYQQYKPACPEFGIATFDGYYEGVVDFGIISATLKMCVNEASDGSVTGDAFIAVEASGEYMNGTLTDANNSSASGHSVVTGTILVELGDITAHIVLKDWVYNPSSGQWEGQVEVKEQKVSGNVTLKFVSDTCPDGWNTLPK